jgi:hypothetical protein
MMHHLLEGMHNSLRYYTNIQVLIATVVVALPCVDDYTKSCIKMAYTAVYRGLNRSRHVQCRVNVGLALAEPPSGHSGGRRPASHLQIWWHQDKNLRVDPIQRSW